MKHRGSTVDGQSSDHPDYFRIANSIMAYTRRWILPLSLVFALMGVLTVSLLNPTKTCVFSAVKARLTKNGEPMKGVSVVRRWRWHEPREDSTVTDANGEFMFPAVFESSVTRLLPLEIVISQSLYVKVNGDEELFWGNSKRDAEQNSEYAGHPISLRCEMTNEMRYTQEAASIRSTLCDWVQ